MQDTLFALPEDPPSRAPKSVAAPPSRVKLANGQSKVLPATPDPEEQALALQLPPLVRMGASSWSFPGWAGLVWGGEYSESMLAKHGLSAYAQHPMLRTVSLDRGFYRPLSASQYAAYAAQVPEDFRFVVKAPSLVTDAMARSETGRGMQANPGFLNAELAVREFVQPALEGLGAKLGALVFQLSPLPPALRSRMPEVLAVLRNMLNALPALRPTAPDAVVAVEVRDPAFLTPEFSAILRSAGATYCLGLHAKMPPIEEQLPMLRALWPGPLVCRWNLHRMHGAYGYEDAKALYEPFNQLVHVDTANRETLAKVASATSKAGFNCYITINNKAEGSAPLSVLGLARELLEVCA